MVIWQRSVMLSLRYRPTSFALFTDSRFVGGSRSRIFLGGTEPEIHVIHLYLLHPMTSARVWRAVRSSSPAAAKRTTTLMRARCPSPASAITPNLRL